MKKILFTLMTLLLIGCSIDDTPRTGDIIFISSNGNKAQVTQKITNSEINYCGIVVTKEDGQLYVLHTAECTKLTPLNTFFTIGDKGRFIIKRATNKNINIDYKKYLGLGDDKIALLDNDKYYNAELIYHIYKEDLGIKLCDTKPISEYNIDEVKPLLSMWRIQPQQEIVTPNDIFNSKKLKIVKDQYNKKKNR